MTAFARFLDTTFSAFDGAMFSFWGSLRCGFLTVISDILDVLGSGGMAMIILAVILLLFKKTRRLGLIVGISILVGAIFTNVILKNAVSRLRPYLNPEYKDLWQAVGSHLESDLSFPSGHMTATTATFMAIFFASKNKLKSLWTAIPILLMGVSRNYLIVHYATDVIAGFIVGLVASIISVVLNKFIWKKIDGSENKFSTFMKNADIINLFKKNKKA